MNKEEYERFYNILTNAPRIEQHDIDKKSKFFESCLPVEVLASRGVDTLRFGPMKPVGLRLPGTMITPYAVVQLREDNVSKSLYNIVGFQTHLKWPEQKRVFRMIPGLENAEFLRYGVMHRNTYLDSPGLLDSDYSMLSRKNVYFAGQMTGVEGYVESAGSGLVAGICAARQALGLECVKFPTVTMLGAMASYVCHGGSGKFVPMNANFGIIPSLEYRVKGGKMAKYAVYSERALAALDEFKEKYYSTLDKERKYNKISNEDWEQYRDIGSIETKIELELLKASYKDNIVSLRFSNNAKGMLDSIYLASGFTEELLNQGYKLTYYNEQKTIYKNDEYQVILKDNL